MTEKNMAISTDQVNEEHVLYQLFCKYVLDAKLGDHIGMEAFAKVLKVNFGGYIELKYNGVNYINNRLFDKKLIRPALEKHISRTLFSRLIFWIKAIREYPEIGNN